MKSFRHIALASATGILITGLVACGSKADTKVWTVDQELHTSDGIYRINGVCYHPVALEIPCEALPRCHKTWL